MDKSLRLTFFGPPYIYRPINIHTACKNIPTIVKFLYCVFFTVYLLTTFVLL